MRRDAPLAPTSRVDWDRGRGDQRADHCSNPGSKKDESSLNYRDYRGDGQRRKIQDIFWWEI